MQKKLSVALAASAIALLISMPAVRAQNGVSSAAGQEADSPAAKFIQDLGDKAINVVADKSLTPAQRDEKYRDILSQSFDLEAIGHFVIGRAWDAASPQQQQEYLKLFKALVVKTYGQRLNFYSGEKFQVRGARQESDKDTMVNSAIMHPNGAPPTPIDWRVRNENGKFAVVDVTVDGVSQSITQRDEYAAVIQRNGGKIDGLLDLMREQVQGDSGGADRGSNGNAK